LRARPREVRVFTQPGPILDIGPHTSAILAEQLKADGTIVWNGPVGVFEILARRMAG